MAGKRKSASSGDASKGKGIRRFDDMDRSNEIIAPDAKRLKTDEHVDGTRQKRLIVVLEGCSLETAKVKKDFVLLASDKHAGFLRKNNKDPADYRPDITHQCLLMLLDSPLNRAGLLQVYVKTQRNVLIEVSSQCRIPRTFDRFAGLMVQLLHKLSVRAADSSQKLLKVIKNPVSAHLPVGCRRILMTFQTDNFKRAAEIIENPDKQEPTVVVVGGIARGRITTDYTTENMKINNYPLSAALTCAKITSAFEEAWGIL